LVGHDYISLTVANIMIFRRDTESSTRWLFGAARAAETLGNRTFLMA
jgi:hypothetical protein